MILECGDLDRALRTPEKKRIAPPYLRGANSAR